MKRKVVVGGPEGKTTVTYYVRAVPSVNQDLVVGVGLPLHLLGAVASWGLRFAEGRK